MTNGTHRLEFPKLRFYPEGIRWAGDRRAFGARSWIYEHRRAKCTELTDRELIEQLSAGVETGASTSTAIGLTGCGLAASFDIQKLGGMSARRPVKFAFVQACHVLVRTPHAHATCAWGMPALT